MDDAISSGGGSYELPTASASTKGGVKIGNGLTMTGETLSANSQLPAHSSELAGKVLTVGDDGSLEWDENGGGVGTISRADWDALTTAQKQSYGLIIIIDSSTGFRRGEYVNGADYNPVSLKQNNKVNNVNITIIDETHYSFEFIPDDLSSGDGIVIAFDVPNTINTLTGQIVDVPSGRCQWGLCTLAATLPSIITSGTGRINYWESDTARAMSFNPEQNCLFIGSGLSYASKITLNVTLSTT